MDLCDICRVVYMWSGGLIDSLLAFSVYICHFGRQGDACWRGGKLSAAASRTRRLGPQLSLGVWRDSTLKIYVIRIVHKLLLELIYVHYTTRKPAVILMTMIMCIRMDL